MYRYRSSGIWQVQAAGSAAGKSESVASHFQLNFWSGRWVSRPAPPCTLQQLPQGATVGGKPPAKIEFAAPATAPYPLLIPESPRQHALASVPHQE